MAIRILASIILLFSVLFMPFWVSVVLGLAGMTYFRFFLEAVVIFLISDLLFGVPEARFFNVTIIASGISIACLFIIEAIKNRLRLNSN